jgi:hypothetical protein
MHYYLKLDFVATDRPGDARAYIRLLEGGHALTAKAVGPIEFETQIEQLRTELEDIHRQGKAEFERVRQSWAARQKSN